MAEEQPSLHIDTDWKKQAQEEKRKLAEQAARAKSTAAPATAGVAPVSGMSAPAAASSARAAGSTPAARRGRSSRELPPPGFASMVQSIMTQVLYYLGELASAGAQPALDLDMAKYQMDMLSMLEDKTRNNLSSEERAILDAALYETRTRFINVASQFLGP